MGVCSDSNRTAQTLQIPVKKACKQCLAWFWIDCNQSLQPKQLQMKICACKPCKDFHWLDELDFRFKDFFSNLLIKIIIYCSLLVKPFNPMMMIIHWSLLLTGQLNLTVIDEVSEKRLFAQIPTEQHSHFRCRWANALWHDSESIATKVCTQNSHKIRSMLKAM